MQESEILQENVLQSLEIGVLIRDCTHCKEPKSNCIPVIDVFVEHEIKQVTAFVQDDGRMGTDDK